MIEIKQTETFKKWRTRLKDERVRGLLASRIDRLAFGHAGDVKSVGQGISELRIHYGAGYRVSSIAASISAGSVSAETRRIR